MVQNVSVKILLNSCYHDHLTQSLFRPLHWLQNCLLSRMDTYYPYLKSSLQHHFPISHFFSLPKGWLRIWHVQYSTASWCFSVESPNTRIQEEGDSVIGSRRCHSGQIYTALLLCYFGMSLLFGKKILSGSSIKPFFTYLTNAFPSPFQILPKNVSDFLKYFIHFLSLLEKISD